MDVPRQEGFRGPLKPGVIIFICVAVAVLAVYWPCVHFPFVGYDDDPYIILNPLLGRFDLHSFLSIWRTGGCSEENLYIPLTYTTYFLETAVFGKTPLPIHLDNLLLHAANSILVLALARRLRMSWLGAIAVSLTFASHPLQVEPVAWCMGRKDLLAAFFGLSAILAYADFNSAAKGEARLPRNEGVESGWLRLTFVVVLGIAAMLSKPVMIVLPFILLAYELCFSDAKASGKSNSILSSDWLRARCRGLSAILALFISAVLVVGVNLFGSFRAAVDAPAAKLVSGAVFAVSEWIKRFFMVGVMEHRYLWPSDSMLFSFAPWLIIVGCAVLAFFMWRFSKYDKRVAFGGLFFIIAFLPSIAHIRYADQFIMADRYSYFPLAGLFLAVGVFVESLPRVGRRCSIALCICVFPFMLHFNRVALNSWSDSLAFWSLETRTKREDPESAYFAGLARQERGDYAGALRLYERCLKLEPSHVRARFATGSIHFREKRYRAALKSYGKALEFDSPYKADLLSNVAQTHVKLRDVDAAIVFFRKSLDIKNVPENRVWLARLLLFKGRTDDAEKESSSALRDGAVLTKDLMSAFPELKKISK
ncbi:MAG: tetratricopeptide repeat protein [Kiritimatiellaeota bacterium]|nr:tetratricopeptide repeat protein [Kiritimatiellota bacterium]